MSSLERDFLVRNPVRLESLTRLGQHLRRDELVGAPVYQRQLRGAQPGGHRRESEIQIGWKLAAPEHEPIDPGLPQRGPATDRRGALGETECVEAHLRAIEHPEDVVVHGIEIADVVFNFGEAVVARHPARANAPLRGAVRDVKARQPLRCDQVAPAVVEHIELLEEPRRELCVPVTDEPHVDGPRGTTGEVAGLPGHRETVLLHQVTRIVTISCGSATNRTVFPRPSRTSGTEARSSARTRWAVRTPAPKRQAPATLRAVAL